jgi:dTDP-4-dehydrorhamnose reductase
LLARAPDLDVTDPAAVTARISDERPDVVIQCAAYTALMPPKRMSGGPFSSMRPKPVT